MAVEVECFGIFAVGSGDDGGVLCHLVEFLGREALSCSLCYGGVFVHLALCVVDLLEALECCCRFLCVLMLVDECGVLLDGEVSLSVLLEYHSDFVHGAPCVGAVRVFGDERAESVLRFLPVAAEHVCPSLLKECVVGIFRVVVGGLQLVEQLHLVLVVAFQSAYHGHLQQ